MSKAQQPFWGTMLQNLYNRVKQSEPREYPSDFTANIAMLLEKTGMTTEELSTALGLKRYQLNYTLSHPQSAKDELYLALSKVATDYSLFRLAGWFDNQAVHISRTKRRRRQTSND